MNKFPCEVSGIALNLLPRPHPFSAWWVEDKDFAQSHTSAGRSWLGTWLPPEECVLHWKILQKWLTQGISFPAGCVMKKTSWQRCFWWVGSCTELWQLGEWVYRHVILSSPSHSLPVHSIKPSSQPPVQAGDDEKNQRTITVNSAHMGKAFKVMNELRRYFSSFACALWEEFVGWASSKTESRSQNTTHSSPPTLTWLPLYAAGKIEWLSESALFPFYLFNTFHFTP